MTTATANPLTPEQAWTSALSQLQLEMTRATFETWLKETHLLGADNGAWQVAVKNEFAKDWLDHRLRETVDRTLTNIVGHPVRIQFVVEPEPAPPEPLPDEADPLPVVQAGAQLAQFTPHIKTIGRKTGYKPMPDYYIRFWSPYLAARWKTAGSRAFRLRQILLTLDTRKVMSPEFTNWSPLIETTYEELGELIGVSRAVITGREGHCQRYEADRKAGQPRGTDCCGRHQNHGCRIQTSGRTGELHCFFWRMGVLEVLDAERLVVTDRQGKTRGHKLRLQLWHSLPILTPFQVSFLPKGLRQKHQSWLIEAGANLELSLSAWEETPLSVETFVDQAPDYDLARLFDGRHQLNPYK